MYSSPGSFLNQICRKPLLWLHGLASFYSILHLRFHLTSFPLIHLWSHFDSPQLFSRDLHESHHVVRRSWHIKKGNKIRYYSIHFLIFPCNKSGTSFYANVKWWCLLESIGDDWKSWLTQAAMHISPVQLLSFDQKMVSSAGNLTIELLVVSFSWHIECRWRVMHCTHNSRPDLHSVLLAVSVLSSFRVCFTPIVWPTYNYHTGQGKWVHLVLWFEYVYNQQMRWHHTTLFHREFLLLISTYGWYLVIFLIHLPPHSSIRLPIRCNYLCATIN